MEKQLRVNGGRPMFARVEYLVITELTIATVFAQVFVMRHQIHNYNDSVTKVARRLWVPTMRSRDILLQAKGDHLD